MSTTSTTVRLTTRETHNIVSMLVKGRGVDFVAQALALPQSTVAAVQAEHGPGVDALRRSSEQLLHQLDLEAGRAVPGPIGRPVRAASSTTGAAGQASVSRPAQPGTSPTGPQQPAAAKPAPPTAAPTGFAAGLVPVRQITYHPSNLERELGDLRDLAASIKAGGVRVPVVLEQHGGRYRLRDGHRRVAAAQLVGVTKVPAIVHAQALDDREWLLEAIDYNLRRQGYTDDDKRRVAHQLADLGVTRAGIAQAFGITTAKLAALLDDKPTTPPPIRPHRPPTIIGRRTVLHALQDWRTRDVDATTILAELETLLTAETAAQ